MNENIGGFNVCKIDNSLNIQSFRNHCAKLVLKNLYVCDLVRCKKVILRKPSRKADDIKGYVNVDFCHKVTTKQTDEYETSASGNLTITNYTSYNHLGMPMEGTVDPGTLKGNVGENWRAPKKSKKPSKVNCYIFLYQYVILQTSLRAGHQEERRGIFMG
jgi:hypothetical protein